MLTSTVEERPTEFTGAKGDRALSQPAAPSSPAARSVAAEEPLLTKETITPSGWPADPKPVARSLSTRVGLIITDIILMVGSLSFLVFALVARFYDGASTTDQPRAKDALFKASKYA